MTNEKAQTLIVLFIVSCFLSTILIPLVQATEDSWTTLEPMLTARGFGGVVVVDDKIYAIGGRNATHRFNVNEMYDPETDTWTTKKPMPTARSAPAIASYQNKIYVIGGSIGSSDFFSSGLTGITEVYDPTMDIWETKEPMPIASAYFDANILDDKIYVICGMKYSNIPPSFTQYADENEVYNPSNDSWSTKTPIPYGNFGYVSAVVDNKICVMGAGHTQIYDSETDTWTSATSSATTTFQAATGATTGILAPKRIYVFGGIDMDQSNISINLTQVYDPETDTWATASPMPTPRYGLGVAVVNDELYAIGGYDGETFLAVNEKYTPSDYIPEFPSWSVLPLFVTVTLTTIIIRNRLRRKAN